jgi:hypothetical protein
MSLVLADRVRETTQTTGTGTLTLDGAVQGFQPFSVIGNNNTTYYTINRGSEWEVGIGTYYGATLSRDTVLDSSNAKSKVNFSAGSKDVFVTYPAEKSVNQDANNRVLIPYTSGTTNVGSLNVGNATGHTDSGVIAGFTASESLYLYTSLQNTSASNTSYASYAVNDGGHTAYAELGINNANYSYSAAGFPNNGFSTPLASFVESFGGPLVLGSWDSQKISFIVNGAVNTADAMTVETTGAVTIPSVAVTGGTINGATIGATTASTGKFTTLESTGTASLGTGSTTYVRAIGDASYPGIFVTGGTNTPLVLQPLGTGALQAQKTDSTTAGGNVRGANAVDWQTTRTAATHVANGTNSTICGGSSNTASGFGSMILGGAFNLASTTYASVAGGNANQATGVGSTVVSGYNGTSRAIAGNTVFAGSVNPISTSLGVTQGALLVLAVATTDATATVLRSNTSAAAATNQIALPINSAYFFKGEIIAGVTAAGDAKGWSIEGVIKRATTAASTALVGTPTVTSLYADTGAATWSVAVTADTTNAALKITVTGQASTTIRWVAQIRTTEMTY